MPTITRTPGLRFACLVWLFATCRSSGYIPGPDEIRECQTCLTHAARPTTVSGNTIFATFWTDGRMHAPMLPEVGLVLKCPGCGTACFWLDARIVGFRLPGEARKLPEFSAPDEQDYHRLLEATPLTPEDELYARVQAWRCGNDAFRHNPSAAPELTEKQRTNLQRIVALADDTKVQERMLKAESLRALGKFEACIALLSDPVPLTGAEPVARVVRNLAILRVRTVQIVGRKPSSPPPLPTPTTRTAPTAEPPARRQ